MPHPDTLKDWLDEQPKAAKEARVRAGPRKDQMAGIGTVQLEAAADTAKAIVDLVDGADEGSWFRVAIHDSSGKCISTRLFNPNVEPDAPGKSNGVPVSEAEAHWRVQDRQLACIERLIESHVHLGEVYANAYVAERDRGDELAGEMLELVRRHNELEVSAEQLSAAFEAAEQPDELRSAAAELLRQLVGAGKAAPPGPPKPPKRSPKQPKPEAAPE